jgi:hypothetical protein
MPKKGSTVDRLFDPDAGRTPPGNADAEENGDERAEALGDALDFDDPRYSGARWTLYRLDDDGNPPPGTRVGSFLRKLTGPLDLEKIQEQFGGGCYRVIATLPDRTRDWYVFRIDGPPRVQTPPPAAPAAAVGDPLVLRLLARLDELERRTATPAPTVDPLDAMAKMFAVFRSMMPEHSSASVGLVDPLLGMFERGYKLGERSEGGQSIADTLKEIAPTVIGLLQAKPAAAPPPARPKQSGAEVIPNAPAKPAPAAVAPAVNSDALVLASVLSKAIISNQDPADLCVLAEQVLSPEDQDGLDVATPQDVLNSIGVGVVALYPVLEKPEAIAYLQRFLDEWKRDD